MKIPVYLDFQASTPMDPNVYDAMQPWLQTQYGNPHSLTHGFGIKARDAIEKARQQIAALIGAQAGEIIFTSGATEANNLAIFGVMTKANRKIHVISTEIEHASILHPLEILKGSDKKVTLMDVDEVGRVNIEAVQAAITPETGLISIGIANNEIGVVQDINAIGKIASAHDILFHTDAAQALTTRPLNVHQAGLSLLSLSGHKLYGPMGIGALYVKDRTPIAPLLFGGGQQNGRRAGSLPTALCVGLGKAAELAMLRQQKDAEYITQLRSLLWARLQNLLKDRVSINGPLENRLAGNLNITLSDISAEDLILDLPAIALSSGSACHSEDNAPSPVQLAIGRTALQAHQSLRIGIGRTTIEEEVLFAADEIYHACQRQSVP